MQMQFHNLTLHKNNNKQKKKKMSISKFEKIKHSWCSEKWVSLSFFFFIIIIIGQSISTSIQELKCIDIDNFATIFTLAMNFLELIVLEILAKNLGLIWNPWKEKS